jgi:hypothetical protein
MSNFQLWNLPKLFWRVLSFMDEPSLCLGVMRVCRRWHTLATHDSLWREMFLRLNLQSLLTVPVAKPLYRYFLEDVITTRTLHGRYEFTAAPSQDPQLYNVQSAGLIVSTAWLGNTLHPIGRVLLTITFRNTVEVLQGAARFSLSRRCFVFCCVPFGSASRGPVFTVAVAQANRRWANESPEMFSKHQGGIRLVMTPVILEGRSKGLQITETDIVAVSRPPPEGITPLHVSPLSRDLQQQL